MLHALICTDKPGSLDLRLATRPAHVAWLEGLNAAGKLAFAGPVLGGDDKPDGSLVVVDAVDRAAAEALAAEDPYARAGLFERVEIRPFNWVFNRPAES